MPRVETGEGDPILLEEVPPQAEGTPEIPLTPRYVAEPRESAADPAKEEYNLPSPPPWTPARPPTPRYCPEWEEAEKEEEQKERRQQEGSPGYVRMNIPVAHVSHTFGSFEAEGRVWRQHAVTWTWPDEATAATEKEGDRVWEEPRGICRDPRRTAVSRAPIGVVMPTPTPTPSPLASPEVVAAQQERVEQVGLPAEDVVLKRPWVWPDPVAPPRAEPKAAVFCAGRDDARIRTAGLNAGLEALEGSPRGGLAGRNHRSPSGRSSTEAGRKTVPEA
ncbi:hypothetical protein M5D96_010628 [Drosophila gunungcola]|uniref:Uncharacterized protein n=1 Tax=Drosophila gunungcola TaxID=103775 RepID=A0A9Q0BL66_9MUSC|nr:hypothetical protein M5D96_010628 [Drosophila gunungcola]